MSARRILQVLLLVQALAAGAICYALLRYLDVASPWLALAIGIGAVLLVRLLITANNFLLSARFASATPDGFQLGPLGRLRLFGEEFMATMLHSSWFMARAKAGRRLYADTRHPPVLLLHGYGCNSGYWTHLRRLLDAQHISHASLDLEPVTGDIEDYVPMVQQAAEALCKDAGAARLIVVAHSMGGLVARAWMRAHGTARVARVITLGTPHHGTSLASFGVGRNAAQMRRTSDAGGRPAGAAGASAWLRALAASEPAATRALIVSIYTHHDNIIAPQTSSVLSGARNIGFGGIGHVALGRNPRILNQVIHEITTP